MNDPNNHDNHRIVDTGATENGNIRNHLRELFQNLPNLTLQQALAPIINNGNAHLANTLLNSYAHAQLILPNHPDLTLEEIASLIVYTVEEDNRERSVYFLMNAALRAEDRDLVDRWKDYIYLLLKALRKLPPANDVAIVYRGMQNTTLDVLGNNYTVGETFQLASFTSTTHSLDVMNDFVGPDGNRVMLHLRLNDTRVARNITPFSFYPGESELLLPPNMMFRVTSIFDAGNGLYQLQCEQSETLDELISYAYEPAAVSQSSNILEWICVGNQASVKASVKSLVTKEVIVMEKKVVEETVTTITKRNGADKLVRSIWHNVNPKCTVGNKVVTNVISKEVEQAVAKEVVEEVLSASVGGAMLGAAGGSMAIGGLYIVCDSTQYVLGWNAPKDFRKRLSNRLANTAMDATGSSIGAGIGTLICPGVGTIVGGIAGSILAGVQHYPVDC